MSPLLSAQLRPTGAQRKQPKTLTFSMAIDTGIVHQRCPPRCRCRTTRRGDPCGRPPPGRRHRPPAIAWALPNRGRWSGDFLVADWDRRPSGRREWRRGTAAWSGDSSGERCAAAGHPQGVPLRSSGIGPTGRLETALPVGDWKSPLRASGMIPRETGRGLSVGGAHRVAAVERLVGATLVVALPPNGATVRRPLLGHYRTGGGGAATF